MASFSSSEACDKRWKRWECGLSPWESDGELQTNTRETQVTYHGGDSDESDSELPFAGVFLFVLSTASLAPLPALFFPLTMLPCLSLIPCCPPLSLSSKDSLLSGLLVSGADDVPAVG